MDETELIMQHIIHEPYYAKATEIIWDRIHRLRAEECIECPIPATIFSLLISPYYYAEYKRKLDALEMIKSYHQKRGSSSIMIFYSLKFVSFFAPYMEQIREGAKGIEMRHLIRKRNPTMNTMETVENRVGRQGFVPENAPARQEDVPVQQPETMVKPQDEKVY